MIREEFIPYTEALAMKELGFDEECLAFYNDSGYLHDWIGDDESKRPGDIRFDSYINSEIDDDVAAPTWRAMIKWFRDKYSLHGTFENIAYPEGLTKEQAIGKFGYQFYIDEYGHCIYGRDKSEIFKTYEEAELACLRKLIELVKSN